MYKPMHPFHRYALQLSVVLTLMTTGCQSLSIKTQALNVLTDAGDHPQTLLMYVETSDSSYGPTIAAGTWQDGKSRATDFLQQAPAHSKMEVYVSGKEAGQPQCVLESEVPQKDFDRDLEKRRVDKAMRAIAHQSFPSPPGSFVYEDTWRIATRAARLSPDAQVTVFSDAEQWSANFKWGEILSPRGEERLIARVLKRLPAPDPAPKQVTLIYTPSRQGLSGDRPARFFQQLVRRWGVKTADIQEPRYLGSAQNVALSGELSAP